VRERAQARERLEQFIAPGPVARQVQTELAGVAGEPAGDVQEPVAETLRLAAGELAGEQQPLRPGEQVLGDQGELEPGRVGSERAEGQVAQAGVFAAADTVFDNRVVAVQLLETLDPSALLVGDEDLEAVAVVVAEGELGAGVRPLAAADRPGAVRPARQVERELGDRRPLARLARLRERRPPPLLRQREDRLGSVRSKPTEKQRPSAATWSRNAWVAPPESARTSSRGRFASSGSRASARSSTST